MARRNIVSASVRYPWVSQASRAYLADCVRTALVHASQEPGLKTHGDRATWALGWLLGESGIPKNESDALLRGEWP
jgi:hypothetical protein